MQITLPWGRLHWPINNSYDFYLAHVRPPMGATFTGWTWFTFLVLDANSTNGPQMHSLQQRA